MQLGKALVGAIIGAAVGIGLLLAVYLTLGIDKVWMSIPFAIVTGLGVRMVASTSGHASYIRGALTMLIALAAYIGGWFLVAEVATARANAPNANRPAASDAQPAAEPDSGETDVAEAKDGQSKEATAKETDTKDAASAPKPTRAKRPKATARGSDSAMQPVSPNAMPYSPGDMICLAIAALVAYELGRGSGTATIPAGQPGQPMPAGTHPDA